MVQHGWHQGMVEMLAEPMGEKVGQAFRGSGCG